MASSYYRGEDHQGRDMFAFQRGPADPEIVGKVFGMKNVREITKKEYEAGIAPAVKTVEPNAEEAAKEAERLAAEKEAGSAPNDENPEGGDAKPTEPEAQGSFQPENAGGHSDSESGTNTPKDEYPVDFDQMTAKELRSYGKKLGIDFPDRAKKADMLQAIKAAFVPKEQEKADA